MTDRGHLPRAELVWPTVPRGHTDEPALDVLAAVLGGLDKENRLFRALMYDRQLAAEVGASHPTHAALGHVRGRAVRPARPEARRARQDRRRRDRAAQARGPTADEVRKAQNERESELIIGLQSADAQGRLPQPVQRRCSATRWPTRPRWTGSSRSRRPTSQRVAKQVPGPTAIRLDVVPGQPTPRAPEVAVDRASQAPAGEPAGRRGQGHVRPLGDAQARPDARVQPPRFVRRRLSNGLEVLIAERHELPILTLDLVVKGGETLVARGQGGAGLADRRLLTRGPRPATRSSWPASWPRSAPRSTPAALESSTVSLTTLTRHLDQALDLFTDVLLNPAFPEKELERLKLQRLAAAQGRAPTTPRRSPGGLPAVPLRAGPPLRPPRPRDARARSDRSPATTWSRSTSGSSCPTTPR